MEPKRFRLPLEVSNNRHTELFDANDKRIAHLFGVFALSNANYLAHAANAYPRLVAALRHAVQELPYDVGVGAEIATLLAELGE